MGCSCLKSNVVIKSKLNPPEHDLSSQNISNNNPSNRISSHHQQSNTANNNPPSSQPPQATNQISQPQNNHQLNLNDNTENLPLFSNPNFEPYLISKNDPSFNFPELPNEYLGHGLKRMKGYISAITLEKLQKVRDDFWTSRIEGDSEIWELLRAICSDQSLSDEDIIGMLKAGGIVPFRDCINVVYDSKGALYEIPNYCINDPSQYNIPEIEYTKEKPKEEGIKFFIRHFTHQFEVEISNWKEIKDVKEMILSKEEKYKEMNISQIRLFFGGKELLDEKEIWFYDIGGDSIVQMLTRETKEEIPVEKVTTKVKHKEILTEKALIENIDNKFDDYVKTNI